MFRWIFAASLGLTVGCSRGPTEKDAINPTYLSILAAGAAREAVSQAAGAAGRLVAVVADRPGMAPRNNEFLEAMERHARSVGFSGVEAVRLGYEESGTTTVPGEIYSKILNEQGNASAIVWMCSTPPDTSAAHVRKGKAARIVVIMEESPSADYAARLLEKKAADAVIEPRGYIGPEVGKKSRDLLKTFDEIFDVKR
ncbi:MAG: hypothetical protein NZ740_02825 [Kiritimatiellae bacterium]|nr:hypothetical protein [Kiritimatiellia bacterium]MDW8458026.1 hypothetical protein [Verrucomicrobiota bacterium]